MAADPSAVKATVLELLQALKPPVHVAALSFAYKTKTGKSIKQDYKGGMLRFLKTELADATVPLEAEPAEPAAPAAPEASDAM